MRPRFGGAATFGRVTLATLATLTVATPARAEPQPAILAALAPADDAREATAIGPGGQVYEPDGKGSWIRRQATTVAVAVTGAARGKAGVIASGEGAVFRLAVNGWTAIRLAQKGKAVAGNGRRGIAALGRDVFELDRGAEPTRLGQAPGVVTELAGGAVGIVVRTERGVFRLDRGGFQAVRNVPDAVHLVSDRWAIANRGAFDLRSAKLIAWPAGLTVAVAAVAPDGGLIAVATSRTGLELLTVQATSEHKPITLPAVAGAASPAPVGIAADKQGRIAIALRDGRIALFDRGTWSTTQVRDELPSPRPGSPPAASP